MQILAVSAIKYPGKADKLAELLMETLRNNHKVDKDDLIIAIDKIFYHYPRRFCHLSPIICNYWESLTHSDAKSSLIRIIGYSYEHLSSVEIEILDPLIQNFSVQEYEVQFTHQGALR
jgi:hypothetical protein